MRLSIFLLIVTLFTSGCELDEKRIELAEEFQLKLGKDYKFLDYEIKLEDIDDSRCPLGVDCIWEGEVKLTFEIDFNDADSTFILCTQDKLEYNFLTYTLKLRDVVPYPTSKKEIDRDDYRVSICIETNIPN